MKIEIFKGNWAINDVNSNINKIFVYGDNNARIGKGGQAIIRGLSNTIGIRTKKGPSKKPAAYYTDNELEINKKNILEDIINLKSKAFKDNIIVFSDGGYGTGLASLNEKAPKTFEYLCFLLREHFGFDNTNGRRWKKVPGYDDITSGVYIDFENDKSIVKPINNSFFNPNYLKQKLNTNYDLIKSGNKVAFSSNKFYKNGDILIFSFEGKEHLVCRVIESYDTSLVLNDYKWYSFEGYDVKFSIAGPEIAKKYQTHFQFISTLSSDGRMVYDNDIFGGLDKKPIEISKKKETKIIGEPLPSLKEKMVKKEENKMSDDFKSLAESIGEINTKMDMILSEIKNKPKFRLFKKKTLEQLLEERGIFGKISKIDGLTSVDNYEVDCEDVIYFLKFEEGFFSNKISVIIKKDKK
jgi:hypothetical protein